MKTAARVLLCLVLILPEAEAQKQSSESRTAASSHKLSALIVTGSTIYTDKEILAATGLRIGQKAGDSDFKEAVQSLGNSGLFSDASYSYSTSAAGARLEIHLADIDSSKLVPAQFENFVWFNEDELRTILQRRVPLFRDSVPLSGNLAGHVTEVLQAMITEKSLPGHVDSLRVTDRGTENVTAVNYRVEGVSIRIRSVDFPGASPEQAKLLTAASRGVIGAEYMRPALAAVAKLDLLPVYLRRGYLKAEFWPCDARVVKESTADDKIEDAADIQVVAIMPVTPGKMYATSGVEWKGNSAMTTKELSPLVHLPMGQPADTVRLLQDIESAVRLYRRHGYITVQIKPDAELNDEKGIVHYTLNVIEGDLYKMGELDLNGLNSHTTARLRAAWTLREGEFYNADYPAKFVEENREILPRGVAWAIDIQETPDAKDKTVDVEIKFKQQ